MNSKDAHVSQGESVTIEFPMYVIMDTIKRRVKKTHGWFLATIEDLDETNWSSTASVTAPSIGWHAWHTARVSDGIQARLTTNPTHWPALTAADQEALPNEVWVLESCVERWELDRTQLGWHEAGIEVSCSALLPGKAVMLPYVRRVFELVEQVVASLDGKRMQMDVKAVPGVILPVGADTEGSVAEELMFHISHTSRHLGMIEALCGALGLQGSATN